MPTYSDPGVLYSDPNVTYSGGDPGPPPEPGVERLLEDGSTRFLEDGTTARELEGTPVAVLVAPMPRYFPVMFDGPNRDTFIVEDIPSGIIKTLAFPLEGWEREYLLNRPGSISGAIPLTSIYATEELLDPYRTAIYAVHDGRIELGGILAPPRLDVASSVLRLGVVGWAGYWDQRYIRTDYTPFSVDQFEIFAQLVADAQDESLLGAGFDLGITVTYDALSGVLRDRADEYLAARAKNLGEALRQLAAAEDGFDYEMRYTLNATTDRIDKTIHLYYPRKGRDTGYLFEYVRGDASTNVIGRGFFDPIAFAWTGVGYGSGEGSLRIASEYNDDDLRGVYPPYEAMPAWPDISLQSSLDERTAQFFEASHRPHRVPLLRVNPDRHPRWGDWEHGDTVRVRIEDGYGSTLGAEQFRITGSRAAQSGEYLIYMGEAL